MMSETFLTGKTAVVTGATRGIGFALAGVLADAGATVAICGRSQASVDEAVRGLTNERNRKVAGKVADVRTSTDVAALFEWVEREAGGPDILVNNAGLGIMRSTAELTVNDWQQTIETNLSGAFYCSREALARMKNRGGGYIINIGSLAGKKAFAGGAAYNASKFGLNGFTEAMMLDHRYDNVRVTHIMPGSVDTDFSGRSAKADSPKAEWKIAPQDIGEIVLMLLRMPERTLVSQVEVRPAKPRK
ncbi:MAG: SDR family oxidoreductase [Bryobacteraceae bacterium]|jgi:NAD(P)-dependent dehydrogenase (short-subunit alcohol dehydrogenase family)